MGLVVPLEQVEAANRLLGMWVNIFASAPLSSLVPVRMLLFGEFWAMAFVLFAFALGLSALVGKIEQRVEYYAGSRA